jgi:hypothetical protein
MRTNRHFGKVTVCCSLCLLFIAGPRYAEGAARGKALAKQEPRVLGIIESRGEWKATIFAKPVSHKMSLMEGKEAQLVNTLCYVDVLPVDSNAPLRVWQREFAGDPIGQTAPHSFAIGPVDEYRFCIAFLEGFRLYSFILDRRSKLDPKEDVPGPGAFDPNLTRPAGPDPDAIGLLQLLDRKHYPDLTPESLSISSVCGFGESTTIDLRVGKQRVGLCCQRGEKKVNCRIFQLSEVLK